MLGENSKTWSFLYGIVQFLIKKLYIHKKERDWENLPNSTVVVSWWWHCEGIFKNLLSLPSTSQRACIPLMIIEVTFFPLLQDTWQMEGGDHNQGWIWGWHEPVRKTKAQNKLRQQKRALDAMFGERKKRKAGFGSVLGKRMWYWERRQNFSILSLLLSSPKESIFKLSPVGGHWCPGQGGARQVTSGNFNEFSQVQTGPKTAADNPWDVAKKGWGSDKPSAILSVRKGGRSTRMQMTLKIINSGSGSGNPLKEIIIQLITANRKGNGDTPELARTHKNKLWHIYSISTLRSNTSLINTSLVALTGSNCSFVFFIHHMTSCLDHGIHHILLI